jgi:branched-chain amino acid transport system ATP-binding protein
MTTPLLETRNLETFYGPIMAIAGVSIEVQKGQIVTILGANGAGKTTLMKTTSGALDCRKGQVLFEGNEIQNQDPDIVARMGIAHVPEGREVFPFLSVHENLLMGAYGRSDKQDIEDDYKTVYDYFPDLEQKRNDMAGYLSGGQQQMLAIGRAIMSRPKLIILDEPSLGLSPLLVQVIYNIIKRINEEKGITIILVEQNAHMALGISDFGYIMEVGRVVLTGTREELLNNKDIQEFYLGQAQEESVRGEQRWKKRKTWR